MVIALIEDLPTSVERRPALADGRLSAAAGTPLGTLAAARPPLRALAVRALMLLGGNRRGTELHTRHQHRQCQQGGLGTVSHDDRVQLK